jgi:S1-C subfamily serine protease
MGKENKKTRRVLKIIGLLALILILGFGAGIFGELFTKYYLSNWSYFRDLYFTENNTSIGQREIVIREPRKVVVNEDLRLSQMSSEVQTQIASIYRKKTASKNVLDSIFSPDDYLGQAAVLTSDGWLVSTQNTGATPADDVIVTYNKKIYDIDKVVLDTQTGLMFIKISVQNLPVVKLADYKNLTMGEHLVLYNTYLNQINPTSLQSKKYKEIASKYDYVSSSQDLDKRLLLNNHFGPNFKGAAIFDYQTEMVGLLVSDNKAIPISYINSIIANVLKGEKITRPYLGINYINLAQVAGLSAVQTQNQQFGALIWPNSLGKSIVADSPLLGKLDKGDIITSIEGQNIDSENDLADLLLEYKSGQEIRLKYYRNGKEGELSVKLK